MKHEDRSSSYFVVSIRGVKMKVISDLLCRKTRRAEKYETSSPFGLHGVASTLSNKQGRSLYVGDLAMKIRLIGLHTCL